MVGFEQVKVLKIIWVLGRIKDFSSCEIKTHIFSLDKREKLEFWGAIVGLRA